MRKMKTMVMRSLSLVCCDTEEECQIHVILLGQNML